MSLNFSPCRASTSSCPSSSAVVFLEAFDGCFGRVDQNNVKDVAARSNGLAPRQPEGLAARQRVFAPFDVAVRHALADPVSLRDIRSWSSMQSVLGLPPAAFCLRL